MPNSISVGELRRNPTQMLRDIKSGQTYTVTDHGEPIASVSPLRPPQWVPIDDLNRLLNELGADDQWAREMAEDRAAEDPSDPWEHAQ